MDQDTNLIPNKKSATGEYIFLFRKEKITNHIFHKNFTAQAVSLTAKSSQMLEVLHFYLKQEGVTGST